MIHLFVQWTLSVSAVCDIVQSARDIAMDKKDIVLTSWNLYSSVKGRKYKQANKQINEVGKPISMVRFKICLFCGCWVEATVNLINARYLEIKAKKKNDGRKGHCLLFQILATGIRHEEDYWIFKVFCGTCIIFHLEEQKILTTEPNLWNYC